jgi:hypothetical protein
MTGSPQAETSTPVHRNGRRRCHRRRRDGAVAHLSQLPAASPRCPDLPDGSLADRADNVAAERDVDCPPDPAHSCWASLFPSSLPPSLPLPPLPCLLPPFPQTHTHLKTPPITTPLYTHTRHTRPAHTYTNTHTHPRARGVAGRLGCSGHSHRSARSLDAEPAYRYHRVMSHTYGAVSRLWRRGCR